MSAYSSPIILAIAGAAQGGTAGVEWEGGCGALFISGGGVGPIAFQTTIDAGVTWIPVQNMALGNLMSALAADGAYVFALSPCRVRVSGTLTTANITAARYGT